MDWIKNFIFSSWIGSWIDDWIKVTEHHFVNTTLTWCLTSLCVNPLPLVSTSHLMSSLVLPSPSRLDFSSHVFPSQYLSPSASLFTFFYCFSYIIQFWWLFILSFAFFFHLVHPNNSTHILRVRLYWIENTIPLPIEQT